MSLPPKKCRRCSGMLGPLGTSEERTSGLHRICARFTAADWRALRPWFDGTLAGVQMSGS